MKKFLVLCIMLVSIVALTSCKSSIANANTTGDVKIEMQLNENYDYTEPFINEKLFCVSKDLENVTAKCELEMDGEIGILEIKNNKTSEVLWSNTWNGTVELTTFSISLDNLKKDDEYAVCFTGTGIKNAIISISFENNYVQERETPLK